MQWTKMPPCEYLCGRSKAKARERQPERKAERKHRKNCECCPVPQLIVMDPASQLSVLKSVSQMSQVLMIANLGCSPTEVQRLKS